uniref:Holocytochrome c-type synthase n=1 Tax=Odontella aurita TaxID=265563 RepID=A0A7S4HPN8_9STRA|mmetsp:Transcript_1324/g.3617  ORF Transcript_1324/g.3617 Transcript_1324/m.3617 type:complete len:417 (+) Transcript_1324:69-1319(+)
MSGPASIIIETCHIFGVLVKSPLAGLELFWAISLASSMIERSPCSHIQRPKNDAASPKQLMQKGGADDGSTWTYPSPQMFYNSLARKGKLADSDESVVESVVALHNNMNEKTWAKVLEWEAVSNPAGEEEGSGPKLLRFMGRPSDLAPKARFKSWILGHPLPFDRHDWTVLRPDGTEVRYIIDYYHDETAARTDADSAMPDMHDREAVQSILVDVRPAMDGPGEVYDRAIAMPYARRVAKTTQFEPLPMMPTSALRDQVGESHRTWEAIQEKAREGKEACQDGPKTIVVGKEEDEEAEVKISAEEAQSLADTVNSMLGSCREAQAAIQACSGDAECARASLALTMCMGQIACPLQHKAVDKSLHADHDPNDEKAVEEYNMRLDKALENISACVAGVGERTAIARMVHPGAFEEEGS